MTMTPSQAQQIADAVGVYVGKLAKIVSVIDDRQGLVLDSLIQGQDVILRRLERIEKLLAKRADPPA